MTSAAIDIGTNSVKFRVCADDGHRIDRDIATTRLGAGLVANSRLTTDAIERTVAQVGVFVERARALGATNIMITGTAACRRASNTAELASAIQTETSLPLHVLSEQEESRFGFLGSTSLIDGNETTLIIDIGGGSTEFTVGVTEPEVFFSIPFGAVTVTEQWLRNDPPRPEELTNAIGEVSDALDDAFRLRPATAAARHHIGIAGTFVTAAAVEIGLLTWDEDVLHGFVLTRESAEDVFRTLATESLEDRCHNPGLPAERADIIVGGMCIVVAIMRRLALEKITISTHGLVDGVLASERMGA